MTAWQEWTPHRALRGWLLALSSTSLAIAAHGLAGGGMPDAAVTVPVTVLIAWGAMSLAGRLHGVSVLVGVLGVVQLGLHLLLTQLIRTHPEHLAAHPAIDGRLMLAGHAVATVVTAVLLAGATTALIVVSSALAWLRRQLFVAPRFVPADEPSAVTTAMVSARPGELLEVLLRRVVARRGPPRCS